MRHCVFRRTANVSRPCLRILRRTQTSGFWNCRARFQTALHLRARSGQVPGRQTASELATTFCLAGSFWREPPAGGGQEETVLDAQRNVYLNDWSPDGRYLVYTQLSPEGRNELWFLPLNGNGKPMPFLKT